MAMRNKMKKQNSKKYFKKTSSNKRDHKVAVRDMNMRGGYRL